MTAVHLASWPRIRGWIRQQLTPQIIFPTIVGLGLLAYVSSLASSKSSGQQLWEVLQRTWAVVLILTFPYLIARALVWYRLMLRLGIRVPWRQAAVSFAGGEMTKSLPGGVYVENYLLGRLVHFGRHSFIRSTMATTAMLGLEALVAVPLALIVGVPGEPWVFWLLIGVVAGWLVLLVLAWLLVHYFAHRAASGNGSLLIKAALLLDEFLHAGRELLEWNTLLECVPTAIYMLVYVVDLYAILLALHVHIGFVHVAGIYCLVVLAVILIPIPTEIGIAEFTGYGALLAYGVVPSLAALAMLSLRLLATGMTIVVAGIVMLLLREELKPIPKTESDATSSSPAAAEGTS
jgi:uncharacterized membrane protein YbhN (UPF0104 family)